MKEKLYLYNLCKTEKKKILVFYSYSLRSVYNLCKTEKKKILVFYSYSLRSVVFLNEVLSFCFPLSQCF